MIKLAYSYGLKPAEVSCLSMSELSEFIEANVKREKRINKLLTQIGYSSGVIASMSLAKKRPTYEDVWGSDRDNSAQSVETMKKKMMAWAINANRLNK